MRRRLDCLLLLLRAVQVLRPESRFPVCVEKLKSKRKDESMMRRVAESVAVHPALFPRVRSAVLLTGRGPCWLTSSVVKLRSYANASLVLIRKVEVWFTHSLLLRSKSSRLLRFESLQGKRRTTKGENWARAGLSRNPSFFWRLCLLVIAAATTCEFWS